MKKMNILKSVLTCLAMVFGSLNIMSQTYQFASKLEAVSNLNLLVIRSVDTDASGNSYATGYFEGSVNAPNGNITSAAGSQDIFISKFDPNGALLWFLNAGGNAEDASNDISVETYGDGSFYITGYVTYIGSVLFNGAANNIILDPGLINCGSAKQGFVAKYDLNGNVIWARPIYTTTSYECCLPQDSEGVSLVASYRHTNGMNLEKHVYVTGYFTGDQAHFQNSDGTYQNIFGHGGSLISPCGFTAKFKGTDGGNLWTQSMATSASNFSMGKSIDIGNHQNFQPGRLYVMGDFRGSVNLAGTILNNTTSNERAFVFSSDGQNGNGYWANQFTGSGGDVNARELSIEQSNDSYFCAIGDFRGTSVNYLGNSAANTGGRDVFITKIDAWTGALAILKTYGGIHDQYGSGIVRARNNGSPDVYISGAFNQEIILDNGTQINTVNTGQFENDHFFARLDANLNVICYDSWDADLLLDLNYVELRIDANKVGLTKTNDRAVIGGMFFDNETPTFNFTSLTSTSAVGSFIAQFACCDCPPPTIEVQRDAVGTQATLFFTYPACSSQPPSSFNFYFQELPNGTINQLGLPWGTTSFNMNNLMPYPTMYNWFMQEGCVVNNTPCPTVSVAGTSTVCTGEPAMLIASPSNLSGYTYTWSPGGFVGSNFNTGPLFNATTYTVTMTNGTCTSSANYTVNVTPLTTPTFNQVSSYCPGSTIPPLPPTSLEGITGSWSPAINNTVTTTYTFTPDPGQCASPITLTIAIDPCCFNLDFCFQIDNRQLTITSISALPSPTPCTYRYQWNWGDGTTSPAASTSYHTTLAKALAAKRNYTNEGTYTVCLKVEKLCNGVVVCCQEICKEIKTVPRCDANLINAELGLSIVNTPAGTVVTPIRNSSTFKFLNNTQLSINFGTPLLPDYVVTLPGAAINTSISNAAVTYTVPGTYEYCVTLTYNNGLGDQCIDRRCKTIVIEPWCETKAHFKYSSCAQSSLFTFTPKANLGNIAAPTVFWDFGDGTNGTSTGSDAISKTYSNPGVYQVCMSIVNGKCESQACYTILATSAVTLDCSPQNMMLSNNPNEVIEMDQIPLEQLLLPTNDDSDISSMVYPNPATGKVHVLMNASSEKVANIELRTVDGRFISSSTKNVNHLNSKETIDVSGLESGIYVVVIEIDGQKFTHRIMVNN